MDVTCTECGKPFEATRRDNRTCGATCRKRASRKPKPVPAPEVPDPAMLPLSVPLVEATRRELQAAGRLDTALGQQALRLAERLMSPFDTGSALAALSKELRAVMADALADAAKGADTLDELAARRVRKAAGG